MSSKKDKTKNSNKKIRFESISTDLDNEHSNIITALDNVYSLCKQHWDNEKLLYKKGRKLMPDHHQNVNEEWKEHDKEHKDTLKQIKQIKHNIINHINNHDAIHFHWVNNHFD